MDQGASERDIDREKDIKARLKIAAYAEDFIRDVIFNADSELFARPIDLACQYVQYELDTAQANRQYLEYTGGSEVVIANMDKHIDNLDQKLINASRGDFKEVKQYLLYAADREALNENGFDIALKKLSLRIPIVGRGVKRPRPSYLDERFNQLDL